MSIANPCLILFSSTAKCGSKIVLNLLSNAFKFTFEGQIRVALAPVDGKAELSVSDTGVGIPESELPRVFERFHRIEGGKARSQEGSGIGLALVHELARLHGATVHVESEYGRGSTFTVSIPFGSRHLPQDRISPPRTQSSTALGAQPFVEEAQRWLPDAPATLADAVPLPRISQEGETSPAHRPLVLVADDNADMREYLRRLLSDHYEVLTVADGESALEMVKSRPPDLLLADVMMPGMDGFRLLHEVRRDPASGSLPVILLSARAGEESRVEGLRAGADDYMVKPFSARELLVCISSRLEITKLRKASAEKEHLLLAEADTEREKLRALIEQAPALVAVLSGPDHVFQIVNREYLKASGRPEGDLIGRPIREALPEIIGQVFLELLNRVYKTGRPFIGTEMLARLNRRGDGTLEDCYFNFVYQAWRDAAGSIQGVFVHAVDVTEQVLARRRLEESQQALRTLVDKERQARSTAELLNRVGPTLLGQLDFKALVQSVTDIATQLTAAEAGAFFQAPAPGHGGPRLPYTSSGSLDTAPLARYWDLHSTGSPAADPFRCNIVDQVPEFRSLLGCSVVSRSGEVLGALVFGHSEPGRFTQSHEDMLAGIAAQAAIAMDNARLFEQAQWIQNELKRSNEELRRANRDLEVFAYSASHDLQEPLRTIAISAELIAAGWGQRLSGDDAMFLDNIVTASRRMAALIQDLLAYTRATKAQEGPPRAVEAAPVLARVLENLKTSIEETGASVTCAELPAVAIHETPLAQLFQNLISNAIKYRGSAPPRIYITAEQRDGWCIFSVTDNGIGIEPRFREQVFGLFKRLHGRDEYPGSGVGLAICQRLVEQYGGRIWIQNSEPGKGSTFCFAVPPGPSALG